MGLAIKMGGKPQYYSRILWENPNPKADFDSQTVTLAKSCLDFDYLAVYYYTSSDATIEAYTVIPINASLYADGTSGYRGSIGRYTPAGYYHARDFGIVTTTGNIKFTSGYRITDGHEYPETCIPSKIVGININAFDSEKAYETITVLWSNSSPTATFTGKDVTLSEPFTNYDRIRIVYRSFTSMDQLGEAELSTSLLASGLYDVETNNPYLGLGGHGASKNYVRLFYRSSSDTDYTKVHFLACQRLNEANTSNNYCVPLTIYGIKVDQTAPTPTE